MRQLPQPLTRRRRRPDLARTRDHPRALRDAVAYPHAVAVRQPDSLTAPLRHGDEDYPSRYSSTKRLPNTPPGSNCFASALASGSLG
jgi:hypothetical protein